VGCGKGNKTKILGQLGVDILGIDIDAADIETARARNELPNVQFQCQSLQDISGRFAGITLIEVLEHIDDPLAFLKELHRVCADDGFLVLTVPNGFCLKEMLTAVIHAGGRSSGLLAKGIKWFRKVAKRDQSFNESQHVQWFTLKRLRTLLREAGFEVQEEIYYNIWSIMLWVLVPWLRLPRFMKKLERRLERYLPPYLLEGWALFCTKRVQSE
jgi:2-polyprenyl-3-methyl-5-hydroxy-6-metoxy-1,4-benzoquinol methylase